MWSIFTCSCDFTRPAVVYFKDTVTASAPAPGPRTTISARTTSYFCTTWKKKRKVVFKSWNQTCFCSQNMKKNVSDTLLMTKFFQLFKSSALIQRCICCWVLLLFHPGLLWGSSLTTEVVFLFFLIFFKLSNPLMCIKSDRTNCLSFRYQQRIKTIKLTEWQSKDAAAKVTLIFYF